MQDFDWDAPIYARKDVLAVADGLKASVLEQWIVREVVTISDPHPTKGHATKLRVNRQYSARDILSIAWLYDMSVQVDMLPSTAAEFIPLVHGRAEKFLRENPPAWIGLDPHDPPRIAVKVGEWDKLLRLYLYKREDTGFHFIQVDQDPHDRAVTESGLPDFCFFVQLDLWISAIINRILKVLHDRD